MANNFEAGKLGEHICMTRLHENGRCMRNSQSRDD